ncbi:cell division protein ZapA [Christensenellaceae bacterium NSJ-63]|uniref:Cell division protein ZapA n=1 Tax=Guopingia tenuis TaxID=2763656 RepID=A0A926HXU0_9FIRM|nr:cell division protein ZapA [Guopingia tenuis]MBC8539106.1 cell division protein ZapA [Guopingia tenuis]
MAKEKTTITVAGREYTILSEEGGEYVNRVAYDLNQKIAALNAENVGLSTVTLLALTALNLTDELFKAREALEASRQELEEIREALHKAEIQNRIAAKEQAGGVAIGNELKRLREQVRRLETENQELKRSKVTSIHQNARTR